MDQVPSLNDEKAIPLPDPIVFDPSIDGFAIAFQNFGEFRNREVLAVDCTTIRVLSIHDSFIPIAGACTWMVRP